MWFLSKYCNKQYDGKKNILKETRMFTSNLTSISSARCREGNGLASNDGPSIQTLNFFSNSTSSVAW